MGDIIPQFTLFSTNGKIFRFPEDLKKNRVVLVIYRKNLCTPCKTQLLFFKDEYQHILAADAEVIAISYPPVEESKTMVNELKLPFPILSDPQGKVLIMLNAINTNKLYSSGIIHSGLIYPTILICNNTGKVLFKLVTKKTASPEELKNILMVLANFQ